ncbi:hypothetical protein O6H91_13G009600 [Diphasiastrum complanatum]|uniref:Uncharacterized protein n=1 Tax=Diphasiastrum complanatum TaxID=34168 RepID=A0ACC2BS35_DIPCM|nr:hypothetical protein O6H91_13G009600 [Diphasiastrum complanatum]
MAPIDPHSYTDSSHPLTKHVDLDLFLDFDTRVIYGTALLRLERQHSGELYLDTRDLSIEKVTNASGEPLQFCLEPPQEIKGTLLRIVLQNDSSVAVTFKTSPSASALQWLEPSQTAGKRLSYVYTQCQAIHARSIFPCQDTPASRITYSANINVPRDMRVVMSAAYIGRSEICAEESKCRFSSACNPNLRAIEKFTMKQPIPPYLFALAVGDIVHQDVGIRTRVYAEPPMIKAAAYEFANAEAILKQAEMLFGPYDWERFDLLILPPSFPYGGMENPRMVFLTPTLIVGDRSGVEVVAHELAHSWTGNLISNATANDFWLNEGFTTYAERRIIESLDGEEQVALHLALGWNGLQEDIERFKTRPEFTKLKTNQENVDPDEVYSQVPYEKGCFFLKRLEYAVGRPQFDIFLKKYIETFRFQSIDTETFLDFLNVQLPTINEKVNIDAWINGTGLPPDADLVKPKSDILESISNLTERFKAEKRIAESKANFGEGTDWFLYLEILEHEARNWQAKEWKIFLDSLPKKVEHKTLEDLENRFKLSTSCNWEIKVAFLTIAAYSGYEKCFPAIETCLLTVGRMLYLKPLYAGLLESTPEARNLALRIFTEAKSMYHPIAQGVIQTLLNKADPQNLV